MATDMLERRRKLEAMIDPRNGATEGERRNAQAILDRMPTVEVPPTPSRPAWDRIASRVTFHEGCGESHGSIRRVRSSEKRAVIAGIHERMPGAKVWRTRVYDGSYTDLEFTRYGSKPWSGCGIAMVPEFEAWRLEEAGNRQAMRQFRIGDRVAFDWKGSRKTGTVVSINEKTLSIEVGYERWRMPASLVELVA
jgi:hypothetical protein